MWGFIDYALELKLLISLISNTAVRAWRYGSTNSRPWKYMEETAARFLLGGRGEEEEILVLLAIGLKSSIPSASQFTDSYPSSSELILLGG
jgi:hypothetical protein